MIWLPLALMDIAQPLQRDWLAAWSREERALVFAGTRIGNHAVSRDHKTWPHQLVPSFVVKNLKASVNKTKGYSIWLAGAVKQKFMPICSP